MCVCVCVIRSAPRRKLFKTWKCARPLAMSIQNWLTEFPLGMPTRNGFQPCLLDNPPQQGIFAFSRSTTFTFGLWDVPLPIVFVHTQSISKCLPIQCTQYKWKKSDLLFYFPDPIEFKCKKKVELTQAHDVQ